jgi:hypothetical protein
MSRRTGRQAYQGLFMPSPSYRIIWEALKQLQSEGRGDITIEELLRALERLSLQQYEDQTPLTGDDWAQVDNTCIGATHAHEKAKAESEDKA